MKKHKIEAWILTSEHNDYDQHGEYFIKVFAEKPTLEDLIAFVGQDDAEHVLKGGGRIDVEDVWFYLRKHKI